MHAPAPPAPPAPPRPRRPRGGRGARLLAHETGSLARLAGPLVVSQLGGIAMNTTDTLMVGPLGAEALAAAGLASALHMAAIMVGMGILVGMTPLVSQAFGAGDRRGCRRVLVQGIWLALILSVPLGALNLAGGPLVRAVGQEGAVAELGGAYLRALAWGVPPAMLFMAMRQFLEGMGRTAPVMAITFVGIAVNVAADWVAVHGLAGIEPTGVVGVGWATTAVRWAMLGVTVLYFRAAPDLHPFRAVRLGPRRRRMGRILAVGLPIGAQLGAEVGIFSFAAVMIGWIGAVPLAAHQVTINIAATTFMVALGTSLAGSVRVGQHVGARRPRMARRAVLATYGLSLAFMGLCALAFLAFPGALIGLYTRDPAIVQVARTLLLVAAIFQLFDGAQVAGLCSLRGAGDTRVPMWITIAGYWAVGFPVAYLLGFRTPLGPAGVWAGLCVALGVVALLLGLRVRRVLWRGELRAVAR